MTSRSEQSLGYVILGVFSLIALAPIVGILFTSLQDPDGIAAFGAFNGLHFEQLQDGLGGGQLRRLPEVEHHRVVRASWSSRRCSRSWPATRSG